MERFLSALNTDPLAILILVALIISLIVSLVRMAGTKPMPSTRSWHMGLLPVFALLGLPAVIDLLSTGWLTVLFALLVFGVLLVNIVIPLLNCIQKSPAPFVADWYSWATPFLVAGGLVVAGYLTYVEVTATIPVCGVGIPGCEAVQTSRYARLFGVLPIAVIGLVGQVAILIAWLTGHFGGENLKRISRLALWGMSFFGALLSAYLTFLEPFVIHATCSWCIMSAVLMILLLWVSTPLAHAALLENQQYESGF